MNQKEFEILAFEECKSLNGKQDNKDVLDAWRAGYIYLQSKLKSMSETMFMDDLVDSVIEIANEELDCFEEWH